MSLRPMRVPPEMMVNLRKVYGLPQWSGSPLAQMLEPHPVVFGTDLVTGKRNVEGVMKWELRRALKTES